MSAPTHKKREKSVSPVQEKVDSGRANKRLLKNKKLEEFNSLQQKLYDCQESFIAKLQTVKSTEPLKDDCKFFSISKNEEGKLVAKGSHLHKIPEDLLNDLTEKVRKGAKESVKMFVDSLKFEPNEMNPKELENEIVKQQLQLIFDSVNASASIAEVNSQNRTKELRGKIEISEESLERAKQELQDLKNSHATELESLKEELDEKSEAMSSRQRSELSGVKKKHATLQKKHDKLRTLVFAYNTDKTSDQQKAAVIQKISEYKKIYSNLNEELNHSEYRLRQNKKKKEEQMEKIKTLEFMLDETNKNVEEANCTANNDDSIANLSQEIKDLENHIEKLEKERKYLGERREALLGERNRTLQELANLSEEGKGSETDIEDEILQLQQSEAEKGAEILNLKSELSNAYEKISQTDEQINEIRQELMRERNRRPNIKREDVHDLLAKKTEIEKLRMKAKQLEKENEQSQLLRAEQEETISHLKKKIETLKY